MAPRKELPFRQSEIARVLRASKAADVPVKIVIMRDGLTVLPLGAERADATANPSRNDGWENAFDKPQAKARPSVQRPSR
jgi:hypothetical protein